MGRQGLVTPRDFRPALMPQPRVLRSEGVVAARERRIVSEREREKEKRPSSRTQPREVPVIDLTEETDRDNRSAALAALRDAGAKYRALLDQFAGQFESEGEIDEVKPPRKKKPRVLSIPGLVSRDESGPGRLGLPPVAPQPPCSGPLFWTRRGGAAARYGGGPSSCEGGTVEEDEDEEAIQIRKAEPMLETPAPGVPAKTREQAIGTPAAQMDSSFGEFSPGTPRGVARPPEGVGGVRHPGTARGRTRGPLPLPIPYPGARPRGSPPPLPPLRPQDRADVRRALRPRIRAPEPEARGRGGPPGSGSRTTQMRRMRRERAEWFAARTEAARLQHRGGGKELWKARFQARAKERGVFAE